MDSEQWWKGRGWRATRLKPGRFFEGSYSPLLLCGLWINRYSSHHRQHVTDFCIGPAAGANHQAAIKRAHGRGQSGKYLGRAKAMDWRDCIR